jgi:hypothetical protein
MQVWYWGWVCSLVVENVLSICNNLGSIPSTEKVVFFCFCQFFEKMCVCVCVCVCVCSQSRLALNS